MGCASRFCVAGAAPAQRRSRAAAGGKLAYVNARAILQATPGYVAGRVAPSPRSSQAYRGRGRRSCRPALDSAASDFEQQSVHAVPHAARTAKRKELEGQQQQLEQRTQELQQQAAAARARAARPDPDQGQRVIEGIRAEGNYAMIFDVSAPNSGIVTADKSLDLTDKVIQQLKAGN